MIAAIGAQSVEVEEGSSAGGEDWSTRATELRRCLLATQSISRDVSEAGGIGAEEVAPCGEREDKPRTCRIEVVGCRFVGEKGE